MYYDKSKQDYESPVAKLVFIADGKYVRFPVDSKLFGECDRNHLRTVATEKETRTRKCYECDAPLHVYENLHTNMGKPADYQFNNTIKTFTKDYDQVQNAVEQLRPKLRKENAKVGDISPTIALIVSKDEIHKGGESRKKCDFVVFAPDVR